MGRSSCKSGSSGGSLVKASRARALVKARRAGSQALVKASRAGSRAVGARKPSQPGSRSGRHKAGVGPDGACHGTGVGQPVEDSARARANRDSQYCDKESENEPETHNTVIGNLKMSPRLIIL